MRIQQKISYPEDQSKRFLDSIIPKMTAVLTVNQLRIFNHGVARLHCKAVPQTTPQISVQVSSYHKTIQLRIVYVTIIEGILPIIKF
jgi:hypothetical protein